jgi:hypothetical protein
MPIDASIPLSGKQPDMLGKMSDILGVQRQQVALASEKQTQTQRRGIADFDVSKIIGDDGTIDLNKVPGSGLREAAGDKFPEVLQQYLTVKQQQIAAKHSLVGLKGEQRAAFSQMMGALRSDPEINTPAGQQKIAEAFGQYANMYGKDVEGVLQAYAAPLQNAPPGKRAQVLQNIQLQAISADSQASRQAPTFGYQNTGAREIRTQSNPYAPGGTDVPAEINREVGPEGRESVQADVLGNQNVVQRAPTGQITGTRPLGAADGGQGPARFAPGERQSFEHQAEQNFVNVSATRAAASKAPQQLDQIRKAKELSESTSTGEWSANRAKIESGIASFIPGLDSATNDATKLQLLDKFAERIAADSAQVLGSNASTDAARDSIHRQNANIGYTKGAIKAVLDYAEAQTLAMNAKGDAQEKWLKQEGNGITKAHDFETKWRQAYDPVLFQLDVAKPDERKAIIDKLPKAEAASLKEKRAALRELGAIK